MKARLWHDGWRRSVPVLEGAERRELESRTARLADLKRELHVTLHARIHTALVRAHEVRDTDASRPATAAQVEAARAASAAMAVLIEELTPARVVATAPVAPVATIAVEPTPAALVLTVTSGPSVHTNAKSKRRAA